MNTAIIAGPFNGESGISAALNNGSATISWRGVEGASYELLASTDLITWTGLTPSVTAIGSDMALATEVAATFNYTRRFYRPSRTGIATYDRAGIAGTYFTSTAPVGGGANTVTPSSASLGSAVNVVIELPTPLPPANVAVASITFGSGTGITVSNILRYSQTLITATFTVAPNASTGARNVTITYNGGIVRTIVNGFTVP